MTTEQMLMTGIGMLGTAVVSVWGSYLFLQSTKDKELKDERARTDALIEKAIARSDALLKQQKEDISTIYKEQIARIDREQTDMMFFYERLFKVLEKEYNISKIELIRETKKTKKIDNFSQSEIKEISSDMMRQLREGENGNT